MKLGSFRYLVKQGWKGMAANRLMTLASIGVLTACLIITGIASLLSLNVNRVIDYLGNQNEIVVYLYDISQEEMDALGAAIVQTPNVKEATSVSKEEALEQMKGWMGDYANLLDNYPTILPASFRVTVEDLSLLAQTNEQLKIMPGVESTSAPSELAGVMVVLKNAVNYGGWALVLILALVSIIIISNTIRLTVFARRREISIMKYVGATNTFIRLPFFVEGMTVGLVSGLIGAGVVCGAYYLVMQYIQGSQNLWVAAIISNLLPLQSIWLYVVLAFVAFGLFIGGIGTTNSIRKHLKV
ncbi:permease-like cell division protein FtsX [Ruminococcaceae bacterium OttesenSCG-928-A16]|nr:permease-like cell division protein FtsX [Ruminococcaceae bacterium OttesenSCG-928-A16]